jgi:hypothetical protein
MKRWSFASGAISIGGVPLPIDSLTYGSGGTATGDANFELAGAEAAQLVKLLGFNRRARRELAARVRRIKRRNARGKGA